jgi:DNA helicase HerA-like ATPase
MSKIKNWKKIGNLSGSTGTSEFQFSLKDFKSRIGDIVAVPIEVPSSDYSTKVVKIVWGRITNISRTNPFHSAEVGQELANEELTPEQTSMPFVRDQLLATAVVLGCSDENSFKQITPLTYPAQPTSSVFYPSTSDIKELLTGGLEAKHKMHVGTLIARSDVEVELSADKVVSRHLAILAMTGGGKTVAARRVIRELIEKKYPVLILDPHGDYLGFYEKKGLFNNLDVKVFYPHIGVTQDTKVHVESLISKMTSGLTEPQREELHKYLDSVQVDKAYLDVKTYIEEIIQKIKSSLGDDNRRTPTLNALKRQLGFIVSQLEAMETSNNSMRTRLKKLEFEKLPDPKTDPASIVKPGQLSILYLGGYNHLLQTTIASMLLEQLFAHRSNLSNRIPPFSTIIEEAHTFVPSAKEGNDVPSIETIRKIITEGRKFGTGLVLISQRPSRVDETILSQCNSFLVLRLVNPKDQTYIRNIMENLSEQDSRMLPSFGPGEGIVSGQAVRFPLLVKIKHDEDLRFSDISNEDFIDEASTWEPQDEDKESIKNSENLKMIRLIKDKRIKRK